MTAAERDELIASILSDPQRWWRCSLCDDPAVGVYHLPRGCIAYPDLTTQAVCLHHEHRAQPLDGMELLVDWRIYE